MSSLINILILICWGYLEPYGLFEPKTKKHFKSVLDLLGSINVIHQYAKSNSINLQKKKIQAKLI